MYMTYLGKGQLRRLGIAFGATSVKVWKFSGNFFFYIFGGGMYMIYFGKVIKRL